MDSIGKISSTTTRRERAGAQSKTDRDARRKSVVRVICNGEIATEKGLRVSSDLISFNLRGIS